MSIAEQLQEAWKDTSKFIPVNLGTGNLLGLQGSKKVLSSRPGQEHFPFGQVTFHSHLAAGQWIRQAVSQLNH